MALKEPSRMVQSARTAFEIIEFIHEQDGAELAELADHLGLAKSTVHAYIATLESLEYLVRDNGTCRLGLKFLYHGMAAQNSVPLTHITDEILTSLAEDTSLIAWLIVEEHGRAVYLRKAMSDESVQTYGRISKRTNLHATAGGKAILAHQPPSDIQAIIEAYGLPEQTEHTITTEEQLCAELDRIREQGYAVSEHEAALGVWSVAAPILSGTDVLGAICVSGLSNHIEEEHFHTTLPERVGDAATELNERYEQVHG